MMIFMMILVLVICILFTELFVGVVIETFNTQKEVVLGNRDLTRIQLGYSRIHLLASKVKPKVEF